MATTSTQYQAYMLRLWSTGNHGELRATLLSVHNPDEQHHFATFDALVLFLNESVYGRDEAASEAAIEADSKTEQEDTVEQGGGHRHMKVE